MLLLGWQLSMRLLWRLRVGLRRHVVSSQVAMRPSVPQRRRVLPRGLHMSGGCGGSALRRGHQRMRLAGLRARLHPRMPQHLRQLRVHLSSRPQLVGRRTNMRCKELFFCSFPLNCYSLLRSKETEKKTLSKRRLKCPTVLILNF